MKLLTEELVKKFEEYPLYSQDGKMGNAKVIAKFFNPMGQGTWLITEGDIIRDEQGNIEDVEMFGFVNLVGMDYAELGYVSLNELQSVKLPFGLTIERDLYYPEDITLRDACQREFGEVPDILRKEYDGVSRAYYCDTFVFKEIPSFIEQIQENDKDKNEPDICDD